MRRLALLFLALAGLAWADDTGFWQQLTPEERAAAGLEQLTPEQRAALDQLAKRYAKEGARHEVEVVSAKVRAEAKAEADEAVRRVREQAKAEGKAEAKAEARQRKIADAGLAAREDDEVIHTRISGDFRGWEGHTVFHLENGQVWQQVNPDLKFFPKMVNPEIELVPSKWLGWKLVLRANGLWCKVKRVQ